MTTKKTPITIEDLFEVLIFLSISAFGFFAYIMTNTFEFSYWGLLWCIPFGLLAHYIAKGIKNE